MPKTHKGRDFYSLQCLLLLEYGVQKLYSAKGLKSKTFSFLVFQVILFIFLEVQVLES